MYIMKLWAAALLTSVALTALAVAAPTPGPIEEPIKDRTGFIPQRKYQALGGKVIGVLVPDVVKVMGQEGRGGPPDAVAFSGGGGSYRWVYTPAPRGNPLITNLQVHTGEKGDKIKVYPALNMANPTTIKDLWSITTPYALVEVEVNDNLGAPADESFVGTNMTVLDGSNEYPLKVAEVVDQMKKKAQAWQKDHEKEIDEALAKTQKQALKDQKPTGPKETEELMHVSWLPESKSLRVRFLTRITDGAYNYGGGANLDRPVPLPLPPQKDAPGRPPPPRENGVRWGTQFGVEYGLSYEVSKNGTLERIQILPIEGFNKVLPPPPVAPGGGRLPRDLPPPPRIPNDR